MAVVIWSVCCEVDVVIWSSGQCVCVCVVVQSSVMPRCGRIVGFNAGNYHGVQAVQAGQRCAIALWFTLDPTHREEAHDTLTQMLASRPTSETFKTHVEL